MGAAGVVVGEAESGRNGIAIYASTGRQIATLSVASSDEASLTLYDPNNGRARAGLGITTDGSPALVLFDDKGKDRLELHIGAKGTPGIALADETGKTIAGMPEREPTTQQQNQNQ